MTEASDKLAMALRKIDEYNRLDPKTDEVGGVIFPHELVYSKRLTDWILKLKPNASEALKVAARGQHIGRWTIPREEYPMDRGGYLRWREALKQFHAKTVSDILKDCGYDETFIARVQSLILKKNLKEDSEVQALEDGLCLVFLETQFADLKNKTPDDKMKEIVRKTWKKMSELGRSAALRLHLSEDAKKFLQESLADAS
jgi:hypothetical protein